jgi:hypothetical protein
MSEPIHEALIKFIDEYEAAVYQCGDLPAALRAVVELHRPVYDWNPAGVEFAACDVCGFGVDGYPCETIRSIAASLGVETREK